MPNFAINTKAVSVILRRWTRKHHFPLPTIDRLPKNISKPTRRRTLKEMAVDSYSYNSEELAILPLNEIKKFCDSLIILYLLNALRQNLVICLNNSFYYKEQSQVIELKHSLEELNKLGVILLGKEFIKFPDNFIDLEFKMKETKISEIVQQIVPLISVYTDKLFGQVTYTPYYSSTEHKFYMFKTSDNLFDLCWFYLCETYALSEKNYTYCECCGIEPIPKSHNRKYCDTCMKKIKHSKKTQNTKKDLLELISLK